MMTYCQNCGRALSAQTEYCPHCKTAVEKEDSPAGQEASASSVRPKGGEGIKYWFTNIFWYHYRLHTFAAAFILLVIAVTVYSSITNVPADFLFIVASEQPVSDSQGEALSGFWEEHVDSITNLNYNVLYLGEGEYVMTGWQQLQIGLISEDYGLFIVGESLTGMFYDTSDMFYTAEELGLPSGPMPELIPLDGIPMMEELYFVFEPMYALVKRPYYDRGGSVTPDSAARSEMAVDCVKALLGG